MNKNALEYNVTGKSHINFQITFKKLLGKCSSDSYLEKLFAFDL